MMVMMMMYENKSINKSIYIPTNIPLKEVSQDKMFRVCRREYKGGASQTPWCVSYGHFLQPKGDTMVVI